MDELHATAFETRILLSIVNKWAARCLEQRLHAAGLPISSLQYGMMRLLCREQHTISELSRKMALAPATLVPAVDVLERHGYIERGHDPKDRRRTLLALTDRGAAILSGIPPMVDDDVLVRALAVLGAEKRGQLLALLRDLLGALPDGPAVVEEVAELVHRME